MELKELNFKDFMLKVLTGMSIGIVIALVPGALLGELAKALELTAITNITTMTNSLLAMVMGLCIAMQFKLSPIQSGTLAITTMLGGGALKFTDAGMSIAGIGDVINAGITASMAVLLILAIGNKLKAYTILLVPTIVIVLVGFIGIELLPYVGKVTSGIGEVVNTVTDWQPIIMGGIIAVIFAFLIMSPVSTVGVALAIGLAGVGSGSANLGICAAGFGLAVAGFGKNGIGTSAAHFLGSPKMQMANFVKKPKIILPILANAFILGVFAGIFGIEGTPLSAGFGFSGLIGPLGHLNIAGFTFANVMLVTTMFVVAPIGLAILFRYIFIDKTNIVEEEDYMIDFK